MDLRDVGTTTGKADGYVTIGSPPNRFKFEVSECNDISELFYVREEARLLNSLQAHSTNFPIDVNPGGRLVVLVSHVQEVAEQVPNVDAASRIVSGRRCKWGGVARRLGEADVGSTALSP